MAATFYERITGVGTSENYVKSKSVVELISDIENIDGFCYTRLFRSLPNVSKLDGLVFKQDFLHRILQLGKRPTGKEVYDVACSLVNMVFGKFWGDDVVCSKMDSFLNSKIKYDMEFTEDQNIHLKGHIESCGCERDHVCSHGWTVCALLTLCTSQEGKRIGGTSVVDIDDFLGGLCDVPNPLNSRPVEDYRTYDDSSEENVTNFKVEEPKVTRGRAQSIKGLPKSREPSVVSTVRPADSSTQFCRYEARKRFWNKRFDERTILPSAEEEDIESMSKYGSSDLKDEASVMVGFALRRDQVMREQRIMQQIKPINGLQHVFNDQRLNFLVHFHSAVYGYWNPYPPSSFISELAEKVKFSPRNAQEELFNLVIKTTIDLTSMRVMANPFRIPILEVGMSLSTRIVYQAFEMFENEYKMKWFELMKGVILPKFQFKFETLSGSFLRGVGEVRRSGQRDRPKRAGRSILGT